MGRVAGIKNSLIRCIIGLSKRFNVPERNVKERPERFLIVSTTGIGDTLWGTPAIRALKETYPNSFVGVLTTAMGAELLKGNPYIDRFFIFRRGLNGIFSLPKLLRELRRERFEVAFIFHASDRIIWPLMFFAGAGEIIATKNENKGLDFILTKTIERLSSHHNIEHRLSLVKEVGANTKQKSLDLYLTNEEKRWAERFLKEKGIKKYPIIGLHPGAKNVYRRWPSNRFIELGIALVNQLNCNIIVTGSKEEKPIVYKISSKIRGAIPIAGSLPIRKVAALIDKMSLFITNDTGPMHIAFALKIPTIALLSPSNPIQCGPYKAKAKYKIIKKPQTCIKCTYKNCYNPICMEQITIEEVVKAVKSLLKLNEQ